MRSLKRILSIAGLYNSGQRLTSLVLKTSEWKNFLATSPVVVVPPKPLASGKPYATPTNKKFKLDFKLDKNVEKNYHRTSLNASVYLYLCG